MRVLGVDPGLRSTGYGVIAINGIVHLPGSMELLEAGVIRTQDKSGIAQRLKRVHDGLDEVINDLKPDVLAIEKLYAHYRHPATAILMGHVRGVVCLLSGSKNIPIANVSPTHVKKAITGRGHAKKQQLAHMVQRYLGLKSLSGPADATDALAIGITYALNSVKMK